MRKLWWLANIYWIILIMYGGGKLFTYGFDTSELGETASYALILLVLISTSVLIIEFQAAWGIWLHNFDKKKMLQCSDAQIHVQLQGLTSKTAFCFAL